VTAGTLQDYATQGRERLLPWSGELRLAAIDEDRVRAWLTEMAELVDAGELNAKTANDARRIDLMCSCSASSGLFAGCRYSTEAAPIREPWLTWRSAVPLVRMRLVVGHYCFAVQLTLPESHVSVMAPAASWTVALTDHLPEALARDLLNAPLTLPAKSVVVPSSLRFVSGPKDALNLRVLLTDRPL
jgi:hypothetical protein